MTKDPTATQHWARLPIARPILQKKSEGKYEKQITKDSGLNKCQMNKVLLIDSVVKVTPGNQYSHLLSSLIFVKSYIVHGGSRELTVMQSP